MAYSNTVNTENPNTNIMFKVNQMDRTGYRVIQLVRFTFSNVLSSSVPMFRIVVVVFFVRNYFVRNYFACWAGAFGWLVWGGYCGGVWLM